jgi:hypothetical protein
VLYSIESIAFNPLAPTAGDLTEELFRCVT